jgi:hypothetical protein
MCSFGPGGDALGAPYGGLFAEVPARAVERGQLARDLDLEVLAEVFPALAHQRVRVTEDDVVRIVDTVLLPALDVRR